jgi:hypothetical protein
MSDSTERERLLAEISEGIADLLLDGTDPDEGSPAGDALHHLYAAHGIARDLHTPSPDTRLREALDMIRELADEVEASAENEYNPDRKGVHPANAHRYKRDMEIVHRARALASHTTEPNG